MVGSIVPEVSQSLRRTVAALLCAAVLGPAASSALESQSGSAALIDLTALDFYVRKDFFVEWTYYEPDPGDPGWTRLPAAGGSRSLSVRDIPALAANARPRLIPGPAERFCLLTVFDAPPSLLESAGGVGLYLEDIGRNWEVYLNGSLIQSEVFLDKAGRIARERAVHGALVEIDKRALRPGKNVLAFSILGDPADYRTGLFSPAPYLLGDYLSLAARKAEGLDLMLIGIYFFFALYHLILFALRPRGIDYLFHGLGTFLFAVYILSRSYVIYDLVADTAIVRGVELSSLFLLVAFFLLFFDLSCRGRVSLFSWIYAGASAAAALLAPFFLGEEVLKVWQYSLVLPFGYLLVFDVALPGIAQLRMLVARREGGAAGGSEPAARPFAEGDGKAASRHGGGSLAAVAIAASAVVLALLSALFGLNSAATLITVKVGAFVLVMSTAMYLAGRFTGLGKKIERLNAGLEEVVRRRTAELADAMEEQMGLNERLAAANARLEAAHEAAARDIRLAVQVQQGFFPRKEAEFTDWDLAFAYLPARGVSGDFYDFYEKEGRLAGLVLGDVSGHGVASGLITVLARSVFRRAFEQAHGRPLGFAVEVANAELSRDLSLVDNYLTAVLLRLDGGSVEYANAAHPDLAFRRAGKARASLLAPQDTAYKGSPLGREGVATPCRSLKFEARPGDSLLVYTDCLIASPDVDGEPLGVEGLLVAYGRAPDGTAQEMLEYILEEFRFHTRGVEVRDDLSLVLIKRRG